MHLTTNGIVLRDLKIEEDRLLTILTDELGVITAYANGANKTRSRLAASTELLCYSGLNLFQHRSRYTVDKAESKRIFFGIRGDLGKLSLASYLAELTSELAPQGEEAGAYLKLLLNTLHLLEQEAKIPAQLKAIYELRLLTLSGYMPDLVGCRVCGSFQSEPMLFSLKSGDLICGDCTGREDVSCLPLTAGVLASMRHIVFSQADKLFSFALSPEGLNLLSRICEEYLIYQVEKTFPTLEFYHSLTGKGGTVVP